MTSPLNFILLLGAVHPAAAAAPVGVNAQRFVPSEGAPLFLAVTDSPVGPAWSLGGAATFSFAQQPFLYDYEDPNQESLVLLDHIGTAHLQVWGNLPRVRIGLELPLNVASSGYEVDGFRLIGDSHVEVTGEILKRTRVRPFGLGARLRAALPSGAQEAWLGNKSPTIGGDVLFSAAGGPVVLAMNLGVESGGGAVLDGVAWGPELDFGLGVGV
ncbi:MAG TPA: hypothetical protein PKW90_10540, partial [Myxococcota bacterium]|nr:hypothetical protein [Myxococcota bacterium]